MNTITIEMADPSTASGKHEVHVRIDGESHEHFWFDADQNNALRIMHEIATMLRQYFIFQKE